ncbi:MAG: YdcF family protein [Candidatus Komeilibacteria bacterium]|nr:YdcF family protein [Candidatus Komeilibacteria bacterium]
MKKKYDAILIMGGGLTTKSELPLWAKARHDLGLKNFSGSKYIMSTSAGTVYKPRPLDKKGFPIYEAAVGAKYLTQHGMPAKKILVEKYSWDTIGNAYFARQIFTETMRLKKLLVITSGFHMARTRAIFNWVFSLPPLAVKYQLDFLSAPDQGLAGEALKQRFKKEQAGLIDVLNKKKKIKNMGQLSVWLLTQHAAYAYGKKIKKINSTLLKGY